MAIIQSAHNLRKPHTEEPCPYGIRISLKANDPFRKLLGPDWHRVHWYRTAGERDEALAAGVFGAPFFMVDGEPFWGNDRRPQIERWLEKGPF